LRGRFPRCEVCAYSALTRWACRDEWRNGRYPVAPLAVGEALCASLAGSVVHAARLA